MLELVIRKFYLDLSLFIWVDIVSNFDIFLIIFCYFCIFVFLKIKLLFKRKLIYLKIYLYLCEINDFVNVKL